MSLTNEMVEAFFPALRAKGIEFVVIYRHRKDDDIRFYDDYRTPYEMNAGKKHWTGEGYVINKVYDLDEYDKRTQREKNRTRRKPNRATIGD